MAADATIYVVDDDPAIQRSLFRLLQSAGYEAEVFSSAEEFLQRKLARGPGCLILDLQMPGFNGLQLQKAVARSDRRIPIIFISGHGSIPDSVEAMKGGAVDFLTKPFEDTDLLNAIRRALVREQAARKEQTQERSALWRVKQLTPREREVLQFVIAGRLNKQIAQSLGISEKTVKVHRGRVVEKMRAESVVDLVHFAAKAGIAPAR